MSMTLIWTIIIVISLIIEALTVQLVGIWFALGGLVAIICDQVFQLSYMAQIVIFALTSILIIVIIRPVSQNYLKSRITHTNLDRAIGEHCLVTETITPDNKGEAKVLDSLWLATSIDNETIKAGEYGEVVAIEGAHVVLKKVDQ